MKKLLLASASLLLLAAAPAMAADAVVEEVTYEAPAVFSWTGGYVGIQAGYGWGNADHLLSVTNETAHNDVDGWLGGVYAGYNYQFSNNIVLGVDADFTWSGQDGGPNVILRPTGVPNPPNAVSTDIKWTGAARARLGYGVDRFMPYIAGGLAFARVDGLYDYINAVGTINKTLTGWTIGGGVDYAVTDNLIFRAEYRYSDFGSVTEQPFLPAYTNTQKLELDSHDIRVGISYKF